MFSPRLVIPRVSAPLLRVRGPLAPCLQASYHSADHPELPFYAPHESQILAYALTHPKEGVPALGFTEKPLLNAIRAQGKSPSMLTGFQGTHSSPMALMLYHMKTQRGRMTNEHAKALYELPHSAGMSAYDRLLYLLVARLRDNIPVAAQLEDGLAQLIQPGNISAALAELYDLADDMCHFSGDKSNDFAWYAKRGTVAKIFVLCELYQASHPPTDFAAVEAFAKRQVREMETLAYAYTSTEEWAFINMIGLVNLIKSQLTRG